MPYLSYARVQETTTTTGTGNITLAGAVTNRVALQSLLAVNDYLDYVIDDGAGNYEVGIGQLTATTTLVRVAVLYSSNSNALVSFAAGTKNVALVMNDAQLDAQESFLFGDGSDGDVTISSGTTSLTRDMYYNNLTISGTGKIAVNGFKVFVNGILDLSAASNSSGAITFDGAAGNNASGATGGTAPTSPFINTVGGGGAGIAGISGGTGIGTGGGFSSSIDPAVGGGGGASGAGGSGGSGAGGNGASAGAATIYPARRKFANIFIKSATQVRGATAGSGGSSAAGDGTNSGGGGGSSGGGGGHLFIAARIINRGVSTAVGAIRANGGTGGNGGAGVAGNTGGGGGGGAGGGGWVYLAYLFLVGVTATNALAANGATGGNGGAKSGTGVTGSGGRGGAGGYVTIMDLGNNTTSETVGSAGSLGSGQTGGAGGTCQVSL